MDMDLECFQALQVQGWAHTIHLYNIIIWNFKTKDIIGQHHWYTQAKENY